MPLTILLILSITSKAFLQPFWQLANLKSLTIDEDEGNAAQIKEADMADFFPGLITDPVAAISADIRFVAGPATSALSALSFVAYRHGILTERHFHPVPEGSLFDKSFPAHCLFHPHSPPFRGFVYYGKRVL